MFVLDDLLDFFIIYCCKLLSVVVPFGAPVGDYFIPIWVGSDYLVSFVFTYPSLVPDSPALLSERVVGENHVNGLEDEVVRLGNILEFFYKVRGIIGIKSRPILYFREIT